MTRHDQLFKDLFRSMFQDLVILADSGLAGFLVADAGPERVTFLDKEVFLDMPEGKRHEVDLLAELPGFAGRRKLLIHLEIEQKFSTKISRRIARYSHAIYLRHARPVVSMVVFLHGGTPGALWVDHFERARDLEIHRFRYLSFGLSRLPAEDLLARPEPLAWALAALARPGKLGRAKLKLALLQKIATAPVGEAERFLLTNCVETYLQLTGRQAELYAALHAAQKTPEVEAMKMTWADQMAAQIGAEYEQKGMEKGLEKGLEKGVVRLRGNLVRLLGQRFGEVSPAIKKRIEAIGSLDELSGLLDRILVVKSAEELLGR